MSGETIELDVPDEYKKKGLKDGSPACPECGPPIEEHDAEHKAKCPDCGRGYRLLSHRFVFAKLADDSKILTDIGDAE